MKQLNIPVLIGAIIGLIIGYEIWISAGNNVIGTPLVILAMIFIGISKIFLGPCSKDYGDFQCEDRLEYILHNHGLFVFIFFLFICAFTGALVIYMVQKWDNKKLK